MGRGRAPCCAKVGLNRGSWTPQEDMRLMAYIQKHGHSNWRALPKQAGLLRCGKSCRLRWINYLRPDLKRGNYTAEEEETIIKLHGLLGNKWSKIASCLPGRTDNEIKNVWNTHLKKKVAQREQQKAGAKKNNDTPTSSPSPSSSTTTDCSSSDAGEQCNTSKEPKKTEATALDILDMLVDAPTEASRGLAPMPPSPCSSSSLTCLSAVEELFELPEIYIESEIWSIIGADGMAGACQGNATVPCTTNVIAASTSSEEGKEGWLENLEKELGLWGPMDEDCQDYAGPPNPIGFVGPLSGTERDPVSTYFQDGPPPPHSRSPDPAQLYYE